MRTEHDIAADEFLREFRMCLHAELSRAQPCPPWVQFTQEFYAPNMDECCDVCGHLHGEHYRVSLMRLDTEKMLEFDFWHAPTLRGQRPEEYWLLASVNFWTFFEKDFMNLCDKFPEIQHEEAHRLLNQSWEFHRFFSDKERLRLSTIE